MKKPSVTELLSLLDKPALLGWANRQGLAGVDISKARPKWLVEGVSIHEQIENFIRKKEPFIKSEYQERFNIFIQDKEVLKLECKIETDYFTGRYDIRLKWKDKVYIMDFKKDKKKIYLEQKLQLVAYSMAEPCDSFAIVGVPEFNLIPVEISDRKPYEDILKSLCNIYVNKKRIEGQD